MHQARIAGRTSPLERPDAMRTLERLASHLWVVAAVMAAVAMTAVICRTAHLLG